MLEGSEMFISGVIPRWESELQKKIKNLTLSHDNKLFSYKVISFFLSLTLLQE